MRVEYDDISFVGQVAFLNIPNVNYDTFPDTATPSVNGKIFLVCSGAVVSITNFLQPIDYQTIRLLGDGTTTVKNNTHIKTNTGADKLLTLDKVYRFTYITSKGYWVEDA